MPSFWLGSFAPWGAEVEIGRRHCARYRPYAGLNHERRLCLVRRWAWSPAPGQHPESINRAAAALRCFIVFLLAHMPPSCARQVPPWRANRLPMRAICNAVCTKSRTPHTSADALPFRTRRAAQCRDSPDAAADASRTPLPGTPRVALRRQRDGVVSISWHDGSVNQCRAGGGLPLNRRARLRVDRGWASVPTPVPSSRKRVPVSRSVPAVCPSPQ